MLSVPRALLCLVALLAVLPSPSFAKTRSCGGLPAASGALYVTSVLATGTSCKTARRVAARWRKKPGCGTLPADGPTTCSAIEGYTCKRLATSGEVLTYRCRNGKRSVRFTAGS
jgi:hypothetical protein